MNKSKDDLINELSRLVLWAGRRMPTNQYKILVHEELIKTLGIRHPLSQFAAQQLKELKVKK